MAGYIIKQITIQNFKYIPNNHPITIPFKESNIVILSGQNGYGKTTLFDAVELLLCGTIKHFIADLLNRGSETIGVLAHDDSKDMIISAILCALNKENILITRQFIKEQEYASKVFWNDREISQDQLNQLLKTNPSMFDIGTYISQSESLTFLQNKYKSRKEQVSSLLESPNIINKIRLLKDVQVQLKNRSDEKMATLVQLNNSATEQVELLKNQVKNIEASAALPGENIRLFPDKEYDFDLVRLDLSKTYDELVLPLKQLELFIRNYEEYIKYIRNMYAAKLLNTPMNTYIALFYSSQISILIDNARILELITKCKLLLGQLKQHTWSFEPVVFNFIGVTENATKQVQLLLQEKQNEQQKLTESDRVVYKLISTRQSLIEQFHNATQQGSIKKEICPLCGTRFTDIDEALADTEKVLKQVNEDAIQKINAIDNQLLELFNTQVIPLIEKVLVENHSLIKLNDSLGTCKDLSTEELIENLKRLGISSFASRKTIHEFNLDEFKIAFETLQKTIRQNQQPIKIVLSEAEIELYKSIHYTYYNNQPPSHSDEQFKEKRQYIAKSYMNEFSQKLSEARKKQEIANTTLQQYTEKSSKLQDSIKILVKKYEDSYKDYQSSLTDAIRVPLMIFSGKIIQNYPLGLGIKAIIKTNQLVFETSAKDGVDAYNILSTGQLNGLAIAILLSVRNVYGYPDGLDIIMIDDPLQTIDDISAISLADLLTQQNIGQIILSTHEDQKARLLRFKFQQANLSVYEQNMQQIYLSLNT